MVQAKLHSTGRAKFVLLKDEDKNFILRSDLSVKFHKEIVAKQIQETGKRFYCLGGGCIEISETEIYAYGKSMDFGIPNNDLVELVLLENSNGKNVKVEMGVGY
jgi:hypothetical protein